MENTQLQTRDKEIKGLVFSAQKQFEASDSFKMNFIREAGFAIQILTNNPFLMKCDHDSIRHAVVNVSLTGLTLNPALRLAYLVPRKGKCILDISYMGLVKILTDAGAVKNIDSAVVYENDKFDFRKGTDPYLKHQPMMSNRGKKIAAYAIAYFRDGGSQFDVLGVDDVEKVRATSESYKNTDTRRFSPWETWEDDMWKKTVVKKLWKLLPKTEFSDTLIAAISHDYENEIGDIKPEKDKYAEMFDDIPDARIVTDEPKKDKKQVITDLKKDIADIESKKSEPVLYPETPE